MTDEEIYQGYAKSLEIMTRHGINRTDTFQVINGLKNWAHSFNPLVQSDKQYFKSELFKSQLFSQKDEAEFVTALKKFSPDTDNEKLLKVFTVVVNLLGKESDWKF